MTGDFGLDLVGRANRRDVVNLSFSQGLVGQCWLCVQVSIIAIGPGLHCDVLLVTGDVVVGIVVGVGVVWVS